MKRYLWVLPLAVVVGFGLSTLTGSVRAGFERNGADITGKDVTLSNTTRGVIFGTAAINADGTVANCFNCNPSSTVHIATGEYQVAFSNFGGGNITANNGFSRWVQPDTLSSGSENVWCNTADRAGTPDAVWVNCQHEGGPGSEGNSEPADASFFLFVAR
jgi:hypothetical protein